MAQTIFQIFEDDGASGEVQCGSCYNKFRFDITENINTHTSQATKITGLRCPHCGRTELP